MVIIKLWILFFTLFIIVSNVLSATHWVVTEKGLIQSYSGSPLDLRRPYDLITLLDQEKRWDEIQNVYKDLSNRKAEIEEKWSTFQGDSDIESKINIKESNCFEDNKLLSTLDLYSNIATNGSERVNLEFTYKTNEKQYKKPECNMYNNIHFKGWSDFPKLDKDLLSNFSLEAESNLEQLVPVKEIQQYGHELHKRLMENNTSWYHYNLAAIYWRIQGNASKALDCTKKALTFATPEFRDIPLHNLAGLLHRAQRSEYAVQLLLAAVKAAPHQSVHYLALGHVYSALGEYNKSVAYYDKYLALKPNKDIAKIKGIIQCFSRLQYQIVDFQENVLGFLQGILSDLHDFHSRQQHWLRLSERLMWEHSSFDEELGTFSADALDLLVFKKKQRCVQKLNDGLISCDSPNNNNNDFDQLNTLNLQNLFHFVEHETHKIKERMANFPKKQTNKFDTNKQDDILTYEKFPNTMSTTSDKYFDATGWPKEEDCLEWNLPISEQEDLKMPIFLPPENKGFDIKKILSDSIGLPEGSEHKLPWHPPNCNDPHALGEKYLLQADRNAINVELKSNHFLRNHLLKYVNNGKADEAEIGQRIVTATKKKIAPNWVLANLASLYWRVRGNTKKALDCLDLAVQTAPKDQTDVMLVSISSIVHELGFVEQALKYANLALKLNYVEPATNFLLAILHYETNPLLAMYYMKNVLRVDPEFYDGKAELLLKIWGCRIKLGYSKKSKSEAICQEKENKVQGMICSPNNDKTASILCFHTKTPDNGKFGNAPVITNNMGEFYVDLTEDSQLESMLKAEKYFPLNLHYCKIIMEADWMNYPSLYQSLSIQNLGIGHLLKTPTKRKQIKPYCSDAVFGTKSQVLDELTNTVLKMKLPNSPDKSLERLLSILAQDTTSSTDELGALIGSALQENATSWLLANAAAIYWRIMGDSEEAIICLRLALSFAPEDLKDFPLISLANLLLRIDFNGDALGVGYMALKINKNSVLNYFTIGNILASMGDLEEAISFYRQSLLLDENFEPARNRLKAALCTLFLIESGTIKPIWEISRN